MTYIRTVRPSAATGETAAAYKYMAEVSGGENVAPVVQLFSLRPGSMRRMIRSWELALWMGEEPRDKRELLAAAVARLNGSAYCTDSHEAYLEAAGGKAARAAELLSGKATDAEPLEKALIDLARASWERPATLTPADLDALRSLVGDGAIDYALVVGALHFISRIADMLKLDSDVLPGGFRRFDWLRRLSVKAAGHELKSTDLSNRRYDKDFDAAFSELKRVAISRSRDLSHEQEMEAQLLLAVEPVRARPRALEVLQGALEERDGRSSLRRQTLAEIYRLVEEALPSDRAAAEGFAGAPRDPIAAFAFYATRRASETTEEMVDALRAAGYDDLGILDIATAVADANRWARTHRLLGLHPGLFYISGRDSQAS